MLRHHNTSTMALACAGVVSFFGCAGRAPGEVDRPVPPPGVDPFCASRPSLAFFCEDFDENALPGSFDTVVEQDGSVDADGEGNSPPHSLHTVTEDVDGADASVVAGFGPGIKHRIFLQMKLDAANDDNDDGTVDFVGIDFASETQEDWHVGYRVDADGVFSLFTQTGDDEPAIVPFATTIVPEIWTSVRLDVFFNDELSPPGACTGLGAFVLGKFRDETVAQCLPVEPPDTAASPTFVLGTRGHGGVWGARYDNATFEVHTE